MVNSLKYYVFYDGDCGFCNQWIQWILKNDARDKFLFSSLQSDFGQHFLKERGLETQELNTIYLWKPHSFYLDKSQAIFKIAEVLGGKYRILSYLKYLPQSLTDFIYNKIAANRHRLAPDHCMVLSPNQKEKFISNID
ncbi:thiol-disulfide oxidoreductase DCC family protein [Kaistella montana]|uniref:Thiol-disulfide oxidoreductase DCC family protein n=1 Tax=Kaistella montana TaxID=1849733 RepID=A0ABW5KB45_9FLAO|nr:DUF393 domain-containing protein [Kaistella montana]